MRRSLLLFLILACSPAYAELIKVVAIGGASGFEYEDPMGLLPFPAPPSNATMTLTFIYDSETLDTHPDDPNFGRYIGAIQTASLSIEDVTVSALPSNGIFVVDGDDGDDWWTQHWGPWEEPDMRAHTFGLSLDNFHGTAIDSDSLGPPTYPEPWLNGQLMYGVVEESGTDTISRARIATVVDSVTVTAVPLPAGAFLLVPCLLAAAPRLRRRNRKGVGLRLRQRVVWGVGACLRQQD